MHEPSSRISALHLFVLANAGIALPLFDALGERAHFFVAQGSEPEDVVSFVLLVSFGVPALAIGFEWASRSLRSRVHLLLVSIFFGLYSLRTLNALAEPPAWVAFPLAGVIALAGTIGYSRFRSLQLFITVLSPAALLIPALFVFNTPVSFIALDLQLPLPDVLETKREPPIVLIVFDELPTLSLLDAEARIDRRRFPNFARLADQAYWFRYASAASDSTPSAVTAIATGRHGREGTIAGHRSQPRTIFNLLRGTYTINGWETVTVLVPPDLHRKKALQSELTFGARMKLLLTDVRLVYLHQILPTDLRGELPQLTGAWAQIWTAAAPGQRAGEKEKWQSELFRSNRGANVERFIASIRRSRKPTLHFLHTMLPHTPWLHLPSGKLHDTARDAAEQRKRNAEDVRIAFREGPDSRLALQQQKHLLQTAYVDTLLGDLLDHLEEEGMLDETLLVLTADHGRPFVQGERRAPSKRHYAGTLFVPLLIKLPGQQTGVVSDVNAQNVDILPSVADVLGATTEWKLDGQSLFTDAQRPAEKRLFSYDTKRFRYPMERATRHFHEALRLNVRRFDLDAPDHDLYRFGPHRSAIGRATQEVVQDAAPLRVEYERGAASLVLDPDSHVIPAHVIGWIDADETTSLQGAFGYVTVSVNGVIAATPELTSRDGRRRFEAFLPEGLLAPGRNVLDVHPIRTRIGRADEAGRAAESVVQKRK